MLPARPGRAWSADPLRSDRSLSERSIAFPAGCFDPGAHGILGGHRRIRGRFQLCICDRSLTHYVCTLSRTTCPVKSIPGRPGCPAAQLIGSAPWQSQTNPAAPSDQPAAQSDRPSNRKARRVAGCCCRGSWILASRSSRGCFRLVVVDRSVDAEQAENSFAHHGYHFHLCCSSGRGKTPRTQGTDPINPGLDPSHPLTNLYLTPRPRSVPVALILGIASPCQKVPHIQTRDESTCDSLVRKCVTSESGKGR